MGVPMPLSLLTPKCFDKPKYCYLVLVLGPGHFKYCLLRCILAEEHSGAGHKSSVVTMMIRQNCTILPKI